MKKNLNWLLGFLPLILIALYWMTHPFREVLACKTLSLEGLSAAQRSNIELAATAMNGIVLRPKEEFSFNHVVGRRAFKRGYKPSPSYLELDSPATVGGGICLVSSILYQVALQSGFKIKERVPHLRTVRTVPPGLDAAVWDGRADLRFQNTLLVPVQIAASYTGRSLTVKLLGRYVKGQPRNITCTRRVVRHSSNKILVEVVRFIDSSQALISRDLYQIGNKRGPS